MLGHPGLVSEVEGLLGKIAYKVFQILPIVPGLKIRDILIRELDVWRVYTASLHFAEGVMEARDEFDSHTDEELSSEGPLEHAYGGQLLQARLIKDRVHSALASGFEGQEDLLVLLRRNIWPPACFQGFRGLLQKSMTVLGLL